MNVYLLIYQEGDYTCVDGVFKDKATADKHVTKSQKNVEEDTMLVNYYVEEHILIE